MKNFLPTLDDMVFEHRNKLYGAFDLRKSYTGSLKKATLLGISVVLFLTGSSFIYYKSQPKEIADGIVLDMKNWVEPPLEDDIKVIPPPPPVVPETPPEVKQVAFLPPEPKEDMLVIEEIVPPKVSEMDNAQIGTENRDGVDPTTIVFDAPPPLPITSTGTVITDIKAVELPFTTVEMMPEFIGGTTELYKWLANN
ncbi:MAG: energy transducer TonB, partial [Spirosomaceae bacterium]|nr:energy transducer TonB [Spirosomataceae bacterium]